MNIEAYLHSKYSLWVALFYSGVVGRVTYQSFQSLDVLKTGKAGNASFQWKRFIAHTHNPNEQRFREIKINAFEG